MPAGSGIKCAAKLCAHTKKSNEDLTFHRFPSNVELCRKWIQNCGDEDLALLPADFLTKCRYVCSAHFQRECYKANGIFLKPGSVPTIFRPEVQPLTDEVVLEYPLKEKTRTIKKSLSVSATAAFVENSSEVRANSSQASTSKEATAQLDDALLAYVETSRDVRSTSPHAETGPEAENTASAEMETPPQDKSARRRLLLCGNPTRSEDSNTDCIQLIPLTVVSTPEEPTEKVVPKKRRIAVPSSRTSKRKRLSDLGHGNIEITPVKGRLCDIIAQKEWQLRRKCMQLRQAKDALRSLHNDSHLAAFLEGIVSPGMIKLLAFNMRNYRRNPRGRRWSLDDKILALSIYKRSPRAYNFLQHIIVLPSSRTLRTMLSKIPLETGLCQFVLTQLQEAAGKMEDPADKLVALLFDEMSIKKRLTYHEGLDYVEGFSDLSSLGRTNKLADKALVFMVQGMHRKFKQPVAFYFSAGGVSADQLSVLIKDVIRAVRQTGLVPLATVCDQGGTNMGAVNRLKAFEAHEQSGPCFFVDGERVIHLWDVPHLFKRFWVNWFKSGTIILFKQVKMLHARYVGKYDHLKKLYHMSQNILRMGRLTKAAVFPEGKSSMKVKNAARLISGTTAAALRSISYCSKNKLIPGCFATAVVVEYLDALFDAANGPAGPHDIKPGRTNVTRNSKHLERWAAYRRDLQKMLFVDNKGKACKTHCIRGMVHSLEALQMLWNTLREQYGFRVMNLRLLNQDSLENLFSVLRGLCATFQNPTASLFSSGMKTCIITRMTSVHSKGANCEKDSLEILSDLRSVLSRLQTTPGGSQDAEEAENGEVGCEPVAGPSHVEEEVPVLSIADTDPEEESLLALLETNAEECACIEKELASVDDLPKVYVGGYIARSVLAKNTCEVCSSFLKAGDISEDHIFIKMKEWVGSKKSLVYPSSHLIEVVRDAVRCFERESDSLLHEKYLKLKITSLLLTSCSTRWFKCAEHHGKMIELIFNLLARLLIHTKCKRMNESLAEESGKAAQTRQHDHFRGR